MPYHGVVNLMAIVKYQCQTKMNIIHKMAHGLGTVQTTTLTRQHKV